MEGGQNSMEYVLWNRNRFMGYTDTKKIVKVESLNNAFHFPSLSQARKVRKEASNKLRKFDVYAVKENGELFKLLSGNGKRVPFSMETRIAVYNKGNGCCALCGRKIDFSEFTIDHIIPLVKAGSNELDNLQASCLLCNRLKEDILPQDFVRKISEIYIYQMEKKHKDKFLWKMIHKALDKMV